VMVMAEQQTATTGPDRFLIGIVGGAILLIVVSIVVVLVVGRPRPTPPADPNGPSGVVQAYVEALRAGDIDKARVYLTRQARAASQNRDRSSYSPAVNDNVRIVVETVSTEGDSAEVKVTISQFYARSDPFSASTSHRDLTVRLMREDGEWRMTQFIEPYSFY
jgi:hypothetical protein